MPGGTVLERLQRGIQHHCFSANDKQGNDNHYLRYDVLLFPER